MMQILIWIVPIMSVLIQLLTTIFLLEISFNWEFYVILFVGVLIAAFGNYLPKCKQNYLIGIILPWTLDNSDNWHSTHRVTGYVWTAGGLVIIISAFAGLLWLAVAALAVLVLFPIYFSYSFI